MKEFPEILQMVCAYMNDNEFDYVVVGGVAVMHHGVPRTTVDIDFILKIDDSEIPPFVEFLNSNGFSASTEDIRAAFSEKSHSTSFYGKSLLRLDIQGANSEFDKMTLERALSVDMFGTNIMIGTAEDTFVNKILFQGEIDLRDALGILTRNHESLDFDYIQDTCKMLGISELLQQFLKESENKI